MSFNCEKCRKGFKDRGSLRSHLNRKRPCISDLQCPKCYIKFNNISVLTRHLQRKTPCDAIMKEFDETSENLCIYCQRSYSTSSSLNRHYQTCKIKNGGMELLAQEVLIRENRELKERVGKFEELLFEVVRERKGDTTNNVVSNVMQGKQNIMTNTKNKINIKIKLISYNKDNAEDLARTCLNDDDLDRISSLVCNGKMKKASALIMRRIHDNPEHPEGMNIYYSNSVGKYMVYIDPKWGPAKLQEVLEVSQIEIIRGITMASWREDDDNIQRKIVKTANKMVEGKKLKAMLGDAIETAIQKIDDRLITN